MANGRTCIQVHGGMGFTWEVPAHLAYKRARVLATQFGTADRLAEARRLAGRGLVRAGPIGPETGTTPDGGPST